MNNKKNLFILILCSTICSSVLAIANHVSCKKKSMNDSIKITIKNKYATITKVSNSKALSPTYYKLSGRVGLSAEPRQTPKFACRGTNGDIKIYDRFAKVGDTFFALKQMGIKASKKNKKQKKYASLSRTLQNDFVTKTVKRKIDKQPTVHRGKSSCSQTWLNYDDINDLTINVFQKNGVLTVRQSAPSAIFNPEKFKLGSQVSVS